MPHALPNRHSPRLAIFRILRIGGFSLIELMITLSILAIVLAIAAPNFSPFIQKRRLISAAENLAGDLRLARQQTIKSGRMVSVNFCASGTTTAGLSNAANYFSHNLKYTDEINGSRSNACPSDIALTFKNSLASQYDGTTLQSQSLDNLRFEPVRGIPISTLGAPTAGSAIFSAANGELTLQVVMSILGRVSVCNPTTATQKIGSYPTC